MKIKTGILSVVLLVTFVICLSLCQSHDISKYDIVSGLALDFDGQSYTLTAEICTADADGFISKTEYVKGKGFTVEKALNNLSLRTNNILFTDSVQLYVISQNIIQNESVVNYLKSEFVNLRAVAITCQGNASDVLKSETDSNTRAKSLSLSHKLKTICAQNNKQYPNIIELLKNKSAVFINRDNLAEMRE